MFRKTFGFSILISLLLLPAYVSLSAQNVPPVTDNKEKIPLYNGVYISTDIYGIGNHLLGSDLLTAEISVDVNIKRRFFPVVEVGYGKVDAWGEGGAHYKTAAPYFRWGINYNTMYKNNRETHFYVGIRYGYSHFSYDVEQLSVEDLVWNETTGNNPTFKDDVWGGGSLPYEHAELKANMQWYELVAGVRVQIYKNFMMGWSVRKKSSLSSSISEYANPWYVPGFGTYGTSKFTLTYSLIYKLPF